MDGSISFDSNSLQTYDRETGVGIITDNIDLDSLPTKSLNLMGLAHANRSTIPFINYPSKTIPITGTVISDTPSNLSALLDTFRSYFNGQDKNLDIGYKGSTRRYTATVNSLDITLSSNKKYAKFALGFICTLPFGVDTSPTVALNAAGRTNALYTDAYTWLGTAPSQLPIATITLSQVSSTDGTEMVTNGGFETDLTGWSTYTGTATRVTTQHHSGSASLKYVNEAALNGDNYGTLIYDLTTLTAGKQYLASAWLKGGAGGEVVQIGILGITKNITLTTGWQKVSIVFNASGDFDELYFNAVSPASGTWYLDDVSIMAQIETQLFWGNDDTGQGITVTSSLWQDGDIVVIDCANLSVSINGQEVDYLGAFPSFTPGAHNMTYSDSFASRTMTENIAYNKRYL